MPLIRSLRRRSIILFIGLLCLLALTFVITRPPSEPSFDGKSLHIWLEGIDHLDLHVAESKGMEVQATNAAVFAVLATGGKALPWLRHELATRESPFKAKLQNVASRSPKSLWRPWMIKLYAPATNPTLWERHRRAAMAALILGDRAKSLAPELDSLLKSGDDCSLYSFALARMGAVGVPSLARAVTNESTQFSALAALEFTAANTEPAVPALLCVLTNGGGFPSIQNAFLNARGASNVIIPIIQAATIHTNWVVRESAVATLEVLKTGRAENRQTEYMIHVDKLGNWGTP